MSHPREGVSPREGVESTSGKATALKGDDSRKTPRSSSEGKLLETILYPQVRRRRFARICSTGRRAIMTVEWSLPTNAPMAGKLQPWSRRRR
jgi:hypothetical protein